MMLIYDIHGWCLSGRPGPVVFVFVFVDEVFDVVSVFMVGRVGCVVVLIASFVPDYYSVPNK